MDAVELALAGVDEDPDVQACYQVQRIVLLSTALVSELAARHRPTARMLKDFRDGVSA